MRRFGLLLMCVGCRLFGANGDAPTGDARSEGERAERGERADKKGARPAKDKADAEPRPDRERPVPPEGEPQLYMMIVMDTVRADHLGACGYDRPTSKTLDNLIQRGAVLSCGAVSPASWTLPSHASYFTGQYVPEHGLALAPESALAVNPHVNVRPLGDEVETLAERFKARGVQTAFLSANPIIKAETGLHQGFDHVVVAPPSDGGLRDEALAVALRDLLKDVSTEQPLFLFVNLYDAHDPYPAVPTRVDWLPRRTGLRISPTAEDADNDFWRFFKDEMGPKERGAWLAHLRDAYDWGVHEADRNVGRVMDVARDLGFSDRGVRMVVTADHGELLGEHGLLRHGGYTYEGVVRVPFLWYDNQKQTEVSFPASFSATQAYYLLRDGHLDEAHLQATAVSAPNPSFFQKGERGVAVWDGADKGVWQSGERWRIDLAADPKEAARLALEGALGSAVQRQLDAFDAMDARPVPTNEGMTEALQAMGYVQ